MGTENAVLISGTLVGARELLSELLADAQARAQQHFFFAERQANKIPDVPRDTPVREIKKAAILGAGVGQDHRAGRGHSGTS